MNNNGGVNKVFLIGEISCQPRLHKNGADGTMLCFTLTTRETHRQMGRPVEQTEEHKIKVRDISFGPHLQPGQLVQVEGKLTTTSFVDEQSVKRYKTEVIASRINPLR